MADELVFTLSIKDNASAQIDAFTRKIDGIGQQAQKEFGAFRENFNKAFGDLGKPINDINSMKAALMGLAGTGAAMAVKELGKFTADSVKNFAAYEAALTSVQRTMGLSKVELDALGESLRTLALTDLKGQVLADDLAVIAEVAGSLGVAKDDLIDFTKNVAMVATATDQSMEKVATSFGKIANVFKGSLGDDAYKQIGAIGSAFDKLADDMAATVPGMLNFTNRMGGVASSMGLTVDQTAALAATLESVGLPAERGATAMNNVMLTLMKSSSSFASALSIDADTLANALKTKPVEALQMVLKAMEELGKTKGQDELLRTMEDLMGKGNGVTEVVLKMQTAQTDFATALGKSKTAFDEATRAGESFNQSASTQEASWKAIATAIDDLQKSVGQQLQPTLNTLGTWLQTASTWWAEAFRADNINKFFDDVVKGIDTMTAGFQQDIDGLTRAWEEVTSALSKGWDDFRGVIEKTDSWFAGIIREVIEAVMEIPKTFEKISKDITKSIDDSIKSIGRLGEAINKTVFQNEKAIGFFEKMTDKIYGVEDALEGHSLTPALQRYSVAAVEAGGSTQELSADLSDSKNAVMGMDQVFSKFSESLGGLSSGIGKIGSLFNIDTSGITGALNKVQEFAQLPQMFDEIKNSFSGIKDAFSQLKGLDLKSIFSGGGGGISGLISSLSGIGSVAGIIMAAWEPLKNFFKGLFEDTKSQGTEAAEAMQKFVTSNISGGAEMAGAMKASFDQMTANNFDFQKSLEASGSTMSQVMGGISENWGQGATAMDIFTQAVGKVTGNMEKAPQVALQMTMGFDDMGLSAEEAGAKMMEIAQAAGMSESQLQQLRGALSGAASSADSYAASVRNATSAAQSSVSSNQSLASSTAGISQGYANARDAINAFAQAQAQAQVLQNMGIPQMASGGIIQSGLAIVNERGAEIARFPGGSMALMTARGATLGAFPVGTEIIPHSKSMQIVRDYPNIPRMATGGTVTATNAAPVVNNYYSVNISAPVIDKGVVRLIDTELRKLQALRTTI